MWCFFWFDPPSLNLLSCDSFCFRFPLCSQNTKGGQTVHSGFFLFFVDVIVLLLKKKTKKNIINTELYILVFICMVQILVSDWATLIPLCSTLIWGDKED